MTSIGAPWVDNGQVVTPEGVIVWFKRGRWLFLFLVIIALAITFPPPDHDWNGPERQPPVETVVSGSPSVAEITVTAIPDYPRSN